MHSVPRKFPVPVAAVLCLAAITLSVLVSAQVPSFAEPTQPASGSSTSAPSSPDPSLRPTISAPAAGDVIGRASTTVRGTAAPGASLTVLADGKSVCTTNAGTDGTYSCQISGLTTSPSVTLVTRDNGAAPGAPDSVSVVFAVVTPPTISGDAGSAKVGLVQGTGYPGATVKLTVTGVGAWDVQVAQSGRWAQSLPLQLHGTYSMSATQRTSFSGTTSSDPSPTVSLAVDTTPPPAPTITAPAAGSALTSRTTFAGGGETGATVTVYAVPDSGGDAVLCSAPVTASRWSCAAEVPSSGPATLIAYQTDASGNPGDTSTPIRIVFGANPGGTIPPPPPAPGTGQGPGQGQGNTPVPGHSATPHPTPTPSAPPSSSAPAQPPTGGGEAGPAVPTRPWDWDARSAFTHAVAPVLGPTAASGWLGAFLLALAVIALVLIPARFLAGGFRSRGPLRFTGRNRERPAPEDPEGALSVRHPIIAGAALVLVLGLVVVFAMPLRQDAAQLRLFGAAVIALIFVNTAASILPVLLSTRRFGGTATVTVAPRYLGAAVAASVVSRMLGMEPALVFGIAFAVTLVPEAARAQRAGAAALRVFSVFGLGVAGWIASSLLGSPTGIAGSFLAEVANVTAMAGIGSAAILLIPLGQTSGRAILALGPWRWLASALPVYTTLFALLWPAFGHLHSPDIIPAALILGLLFGGIGLGAYLWRTSLRTLFISSR
ncbi:hypothetical protein [Mycetocola sp. JXN-3]|uniref:hypothetical protein n=1 Tax=Mycetocola sp. JXN-3 TaxID=2116510 RepID=UPI00165CF627|nr:hypothetical protein [Mycetocola sp. JXN-3]